MTNEPEKNNGSDEPVNRLVTQRQLHILRHALGLSQSGNEYRNRYAAGGNDVADCDRLVELGYMTKHEVEWIPDACFTVTSAGREVARAG